MSLSIYIHSWNTSLYKGRELSFQDFQKKDGVGSDFSHKREVFVKKGGCFKKGGFTYFHSN